MSGRVRFAHVLPQKVTPGWFSFDFIVVDSRRSVRVFSVTRRFLYRQC